MALDGKPPNFYVMDDSLSTPDGTCIRNCIHIRDLASATSKPWSLVNGGLGERIAINLGTGQASP